MQAIIDALKTMPESPGVYRMIGKDNDVLYVGKAKNLKKRVSNYTHLDRLCRRIGIMVMNTVKMEIIITKDEKEALRLECDLIKNLKPKYNILLTDDKSFPHIFIPLNEDFPPILKHRGEKKKKGFYFGPLTDVTSLNQSLSFIEKMFQIRSCKDSIFKNRTRPCLLHQILRCSAPCTGLISKQEYQEQITKVIDFLNGKNKNLKKDLELKMKQASDNLEYEVASKYRDKIRFLEQTVKGCDNDLKGIINADLIAFDTLDDSSIIDIFFIRGEKIVGNYSHKIDGEFDADNAFSEFISRFYQEKDLPKELIVSYNFSDKLFLENALGLKIVCPKIGAKKSLVDFALTNAKTKLIRDKANSDKIEESLNGLKELLDLSKLSRIEVYDNSHLSGTNPVGVMVCFKDKGWDKNSYRRYNIKSGFEQSDFLMMKEVLTRRFLGKDKDIIPDLILLDGGHPQLNAYLKVEAELGINIPVLCIAKGESRYDGLEHFYKKDGTEIKIGVKSEIRFFLQRLRDESHRFAIGFQRFKRIKKAFN